MVELGKLTINKAVADSAEVQKTLLFLPGLLTDGIEASDDPLIDVRNGAYAESFSRRNPRADATCGGGAFRCRRESRPTGPNRSAPRAAINGLLTNQT